MAAVEHKLTGPAKPILAKKAGQPPVSIKNRRRLKLIEAQLAGDSLTSSKATARAEARADFLLSIAPVIGSIDLELVAGEMKDKRSNRLHIELGRNESQMTRDMGLHLWCDDRDGGIQWRFAMCGIMNFCAAIQKMPDVKAFAKKAKAEKFKVRVHPLPIRNERSLATKASLQLVLTIAKKPIEDAARAMTMGLAFPCWASNIGPSVKIDKVIPKSQEHAKHKLLARLIPERVMGLLSSRFRPQNPNI